LSSTSSSTTTITTKITTTATTTISIFGASDLDVSNDISDIEEEEDIKDEGLIAEESEVKEVFVLPEDPSVNVIEDDVIDTPIIKTSSSAQLPRFCKFLKFKCNAKSSHPCCPKSARVASKATTTTKSPIKEKEIHSNDDSLNSNNANNSTKEFDQTKKSEKLKPARSSIFTKPREDKSNTYKSSSSFFAKRNKNRDKNKGNKSFVCRIVNCQINKRHKCCLDSEVPEESDNNVRGDEKAEEGVTQYPSTKTAPRYIASPEQPKSVVPQETELTTTEYSMGNVEDISTEDFESLTTTVDIDGDANSEETTLVTPTNSDKSETDDNQFDTTSEHIYYETTERDQTTLTSNDEMTTFNDEDLSAEVTIQAEDVMNMYTTESGNTQRSGETDGFQTATSIVITKDEETNVFVAHSNYEQHDEVTHIEAETSVTTSQPQSTSLLEVTDYYEPDSLNEVEEYFETDYEPSDDTGSQAGEEMRYEEGSIIYEDDINNEVLQDVECFQIDCELSPQDICCLQKNIIDKRHLKYLSSPYTVLSLPGFGTVRQPMILEYPGRVTATVTRVEKSFSW